jgi:NADH-quinone oxidoreductase subunit N
LLRIFVTTFPTIRADWQPIIWVLAVISLLLGATVGIVQRDVKRMLAYSSINHAGFVLLGLYLGTQRGVSGSLYYLFTYSFMVLGSFAVITIIGGLGDEYHDLDRWRGLARRQPWLAVPMIIFLLAQAGMPATTGLWAKIYVIEGAVGTPGGDALALIAMISAVIAGFFYLRLVLYMVSPPAGAVEVSPIGDYDPDEVREALVSPLAVSASAVNVSVAGAGGAAVATIQSPLSSLGGSTSPELTDADLEVPLSVWTGIAICAFVTVLFGVWPSPIINFAHAASLIFH